jgi:aspartyl/glutamyl-tRNA(Asn/Gln) amidotransferase C subunit
MASTDDVARLAALARIEIPEADRARIAKEFDSILAYIGQLDELDIAVGAAPHAPKLHNVTREDVNAYAPRTWTERIVRLFPARVGNALSVKKILSND